MPECDIGENIRGIQYDQPWLSNAIPFPGGKVDSCRRFAPKNRTVTEGEECSADMFDESLEITCSDYVYTSDERNVQTEVKMTSTVFENVQTWFQSFFLYFLYFSRFSSISTVCIATGWR